MKNRLEQLRAIENNIEIKVALARSSSIGVDTQEDYLALKKIMEYKSKIMKIAYQGIEGSYSESCAKELYPECETIPCKTFDDVFKKANDDETINAIIPESNKTTGNIGVEYLIFKYRLNIYMEKFFQSNTNF